MVQEVWPIVDLKRITGTRAPESPGDSPLGANYAIYMIYQPVRAPLPSTQLCSLWGMLWTCSLINGIVTFSQPSNSSSIKDCSL